MRFIHTADWQIGMLASHAGAAAKVVRKARLQSARTVVDLARQQSVDFMILAGDTFESNAVSRDLIVEVADILSGASCPVYLIAGNHDPLQNGSVWDHESWKQASNIRILREPAPVPVADGFLYPCPITRKRSTLDPTEWISDEKGTGIRVGIAHGNAGDFMADEGGFPIAFDAPLRTGLDYLALGHWHSTVLFTQGGTTRMAYSGTHETTRFGENDSGNVLLVEIPERGVGPAITKLSTASLEWEQIEETITEPGRLAEITRRLNKNASKNRLVDVKLTGLLFERDCDELDRIRESARHYLHGRVDDSGLRAAPGDDDWIQLLPAGVAQHAAAQLRMMAVEQSEVGSVATQALRELYALQSELQS